MINNQAVVFSFLLYVLYVLLPVVPAILIYKLFPDTKVTVSGPLQGLSLNTSGAFAAYVATVLLGFFLIRNIESQIKWTRLYPVQGVLDLSANQEVTSDQLYSRQTILLDPSGKNQSQYLYFVDLMDHPAAKTTVWLNYFQLPDASGVGAPPAPSVAQSVSVDLVADGRSPQHFVLQTQDGHTVAVAKDAVAPPPGAALVSSNAH